jgi:iron complex outermembrane receptor protein
VSTRPSSAIALFLSIAGTAIAPAHAQHGDEILEELTVTVRRMQERLLDVPLAVTAFDASTIGQAGLRTLDDVAGLTPGLTFSNVFGEVLPVPVIRGLAPTAIFQENNAGIFVDGVYVSGREGLNFSQLDLAKVEVVKGPQSAAYGRNTFAGAVLYTTARPTDHFQSSIEGQYGSDNKALGKLILSGPLGTDKLRGRAAFLYDSWDGSYNNHFPGGGPDIGGYELTTFQGSLLFAPNDSFEALLGFYVSDDQFDPPAMTPVPANCEERALVDPMNPGLQNFCGELPEAIDDSLSVVPAAIGEDRDLVRGHLKLAWNLGGGTLTSLTGYSSLQHSYFLDAGLSGGENTFFAYQAPPFAPFPGVPGFTRTFPTAIVLLGPGSEVEEISEEIRFSSPADNSLRFQAGAYYYSVESRSTDDGAVATQELPADFFSFCPCILTGPTTGIALGFADQVFRPWFDNPQGDSNSAVVLTEETEAYALFGLMEVDLSDRWTAHAEARFTNEEKSFDDAILNRSERDDWNFFTWRADLRYKPNERTTWYAAIANGEKSGGFDTASPGGQIVVQPFDPEKNITYELGFKGISASGRLQGDLAVYFIDWTDIVIPQVVTELEDGTPVTPFSLDVNAGDASVVGAELSLAASLTDRWSALLGVSWTDAEYDDALIETFVEFPSFAPDGDVSGNQVLRQSEWEGSLSLDYRAPLGSAFQWFMRGDLIYQGEQFADATNQAIVPEHTYFNARMGWESERYLFEFWALNVFEDDAPTGAFREVYFSNTYPDGTFGFAEPFFPYRYSVSHPRLRQLGVTVRVKF